MMNRILKRPMFRMGGRADEGITSLRPRYEEGGNVGFFQGILNALNPTTGQIVQRIQKQQSAPSLGEVLFSPSKKPLEFRTQSEADEFLEANPDFMRPIKILGSDETINVPSDDTVTGAGTVTPGVGTINTETTGTDKQQSDQELIKSYMDMFSEAMGESEDDVSRQRYLELAKFGANLLGQPGGDLLGSIGRAAVPSIQGLAEGAARKSAADREIKLAGLKTAIAQMDDPTAQKIKTLARMSGMDEKDVAKLMLDTDSGSDFELQIKALEGSVGAENAFKIAEQIKDAGLKLSQVKPIPVDKKGKPKEGVPDGYYYDEDANIYKVKNGKPSILKNK
jgi:hypothetical protein